MGVNDQINEIKDKVEKNKAKNSKEKNFEKKENKVFYVKVSR